jgi:hypothetical protein
MPSLVADFEMHAYWQEYAEEHPRLVNVVTHLIGDGYLDAHHCQVKASAAKEFDVRKTPLLHQAKHPEPTGTGSNVKSALEIHQELSQDMQQSTLMHEFGNPLKIPCPRCTCQT